MNNALEVYSFGFDLRMWDLSFLTTAKLIPLLPTSTSHGPIMISSLFSPQMQKQSVKSCLSPPNGLRKETIWPFFIFHDIKVIHLSLC